MRTIEKNLILTLLQLLVANISTGVGVFSYFRQFNVPSLEERQTCSCYVSLTDAKMRVISGGTK